MKALEAISVLAFASQALAHGYIYRVTADNTVYPGWDIFIDGGLKSVPKRIAYATGNMNTGPVMQLNSSDLACNSGHNPIPGAIAEVRAGANITFHWSHWLYSHKGPITAWMAPYVGDIAQVDLNKLEFIKFAEDTIDKNGVWANVRMMDQTNGTWTATVPADIKPGNYIIRQEIMALHFAQSTPPAFEGLPVGPQYYMTCFNFKVTGSGTATPKGATFPGAYHADEPGLHFDVKSNATNFPPIGPAVYKSAYEITLEPKEHVVVSPTGQGNASDTAYYQNQYNALKQQGAITSYFDSIGG